MERQAESPRMFRIWSPGETRMAESWITDRRADRVLYWPIVLAVAWSAGDMIPYVPTKIKLGFRQIFHGTVERNPASEQQGLKKSPFDYFKILYADTALGGERAPTRCGHAFFGTKHCLFATDAPFDPERGRALIADTLKGVGALGLPEAEMKLIFAGNAQALLKL